MEIALKSLDIITLGEAHEYNCLFLKIKKNELVDRLYRRYVRKEEIANTRNILEKLYSQLNIKHEKKLFSQLLEAVEDQIECSKLCFERSGEYIPIRIILASSPYRYLEIPLEDYDNLEGDPLWMRPEYVLEKYYPEEKQKRDKEILLQIQESIRNEDENKEKQ